MIILSMIIGAIMGGAVQHQSVYCECFRDDFKGAYCESIKNDGLQGSCSK